VVEVSVRASPNLRSAGACPPHRVGRLLTPIARKTSNTQRNLMIPWNSYESRWSFPRQLFGLQPFTVVQKNAEPGEPRGVSRRGRRGRCQFPTWDRVSPPEPIAVEQPKWFEGEAVSPRPFNRFTNPAALSGRSCA